MKPVIQTKFGDKKGNCFSACIASILELRIEQVPNFCVDYGENWVKETDKWLRENWNLTLLGFVSKGRAGIYSLPAIYHLVSGQSERGINHSCVAFQGKIVHDPHPDQTGIKEIEEWDFLIPTHEDTCIISMLFKD